MDHLDCDLPGPMNAVFYRDLKQRFEGIDPSSWFERETATQLKSALKYLLRNSLILDPTGTNAGEGPYSRYFLCTQVKDKDMPWDSSEVDW
jgi:hypothetical protein